MFKPYLFVFLYAITGTIGWQAYSAISTEDTSLAAIKNQILTYWSGEEYPGSNTLSNEALSENRSQLATYEKELAQLRNLPKEALPAANVITQEEIKKTSLLEQLPTWNGIEPQIELNPDVVPLLNRLKNPAQTE